MKKLLPLLSLILIFSCEPQDNTYFFVTTLGSDTLAIERIERENGELEADVVLRSPSISLTQYEISWNDSKTLQALTATSFDKTFGEDGEGGTVIQNITSAGQSLNIETQGRNGMVNYTVANDKSLLPFIDMVHWPYDVAFTRAYQNTNDSTDQYLLSGRRASNFIIHRVDGNDFTVRHPSRGVMDVKTDDNGNLTFLDAKGTTRKLKVYRTDKLDFDALTERFLAIDAIGSPFGTLSPAVEESFNFKNTDFKVTYGSPQKRGRDIFGGIVSYGERWRTGANRATHFSTTRDLTINGQKVPAGEYTLFSIPEENGGTLIINKQTGQNGRSYNQERDLMRIEMTRAQSETFYEGFTVKVVETNNGGKIQLLWDKTSYEVAFQLN